MEENKSVSNTAESGPNNPAALSTKPLMETNPGLKYVAPIGRSGWAIAAGYMAIVGSLVIPAPIAIVLGIIALSDIKKHPEKLGKTRAWFAIVYSSGVLLTAAWIIWQISKNS
jgi:hypothetical protein